MSIDCVLSIMCFSWWQTRVAGEALGGSHYLLVARIVEPWTQPAVVMTLASMLSGRRRFLILPR
jgi:hypothetical protein